MIIQTLNATLLMYPDLTQTLFECFYHKRPTGKGLRTILQGLQKAWRLGIFHSTGIAWTSLGQDIYVPKN